MNLTPDGPPTSHSNYVEELLVYLELTLKLTAKILPLAVCRINLVKCLTSIINYCLLLCRSKLNNIPYSTKHHLLLAFYKILLV